MKLRIVFSLAALLLLLAVPRTSSAQLIDDTLIYVWDGVQVAGKISALKTVNEGGVRIKSSAPGTRGEVSVEFSGAFTEKGELIYFPFKNSDGILFTMRGISNNKSIELWKANVHGLPKGAMEWKPLGAYDLNPNDLSIKIELKGDYQGVKVDVHPVKGTGQWSVLFDAVTYL